MSGRIPWSIYSGEEVEKVLATYICLENRNAERIRPSQGDRGIDLIVRKQDGIIVYQIKKFSDNLKSSQKRQIEDSWNRLRDYISSKTVRLSEWHLVMPLDPTPENDDWFQAIGKEADVKTVWDGLTRVDAWTAAMPWVADYYFADGKAAEAETIARLMQIAHLEDPSSPEELNSQLIALQQRMDEINPYYSFSISVRSKYENALAIPPPRPGLVMASIEELAGGGSIVIEVFAKFAAAAELCPITFSISSVAGDEDSRLAFESLLNYGEPVQSIPAMLTGPTIDLPLPFASQGAEGTMTVIPVEHEPTARCSLSWKDVLSLPLETLYVHSGELGYKWAGKDASGFLQVTLEGDSRKGNGTFNLTVNHERLIDGWDPRELKKTTSFLSIAGSGDVDFEIDGSKRFKLPFHELGIPPEYIESISSFADDLLVIFESATEAFEIPSASSILCGNAADVSHNAMLLRAGCSNCNWDDLSIEMRERNDHILVPVGPTLVKVVSPFKVNLSNKIVRCGLLESKFIGVLSLAEDKQHIIAKPHPGYGSDLIRVALSPDAENILEMNQLFVAEAPSPERWHAEVQVVRNSFNSANGL